MHRIARPAGTLLCVLGLLATGLFALETEQARGKAAKGKPKNEKHEKHDEPEFSLEFLLDFSSEKARLYARESQLIGQKPLPPGIRKNLARGKPLPPGIAKREMPASFLKKLPAHDDYEWHMAGVDLVLTARVDGLVKEVVRDVFK